MKRLPHHDAACVTRETFTSPRCRVLLIVVRCLAVPQAVYSTVMVYNSSYTRGFLYDSTNLGVNSSSRRDAFLKAVNTGTVVASTQTFPSFGGFAGVVDVVLPVFPPSFNATGNARHTVSARGLVVPELLVVTVRAQGPLRKSGTGGASA